MIRFAPGVFVAHWNITLHEVLEQASAWSNLRGIGVDVNAIDDKQHGPATLHGWGLALDLDTAGDKPDDLRDLYGFLNRYLPLSYDVVLEKDHVHVEFDTHRPKVAGAPPAAPAPPRPA